MAFRNGKMSHISSAVNCVTLLLLLKGEGPILPEPCRQQFLISCFFILPTSSKGFSLKAAGLLRASPSLGTPEAGEGGSSDNKGSQVVKFQQGCQASVRRKVTSAGVWGKGGLQYFSFSCHIFASNLLCLHSD